MDTNKRRADNQIATSVISLLSKDISSFKAIAVRLGIDVERALPFIALPLGKMSIIGEYFSRIKEDFNFRR
jgi:hypothetical protein